MGSHRPTAVESQRTYKPVPLMQGFKTSAPKQAAHDTSTIDFFFFPEIVEPQVENPFAKLRVPLLPDNYTPDRSPGSLNAVEALDQAVPRPEISVIASHPEQVLPATISEVVGNDGLDIDISKLTAGFTDVVEDIKAPNTLKELWSDFLDDILGPKNPKLAV